MKWFIVPLIARQKAIASSEYAIHLTTRFDGVHAFGYNSTGSAPIWMKLRALWVHCLPLAWQILGAIREEARAKERGEFFCQINNARFYRFPVGQISRNLHTRRGSVSRWILSEHIFENFSVRGRFFKKANFWPKSSTTCDFRTPNSLTI